MINNIRAKGILQIIFDLLNDKTKLYIVNYNKSLYKKLEIDLEFLKKTSGKYRKCRLEGKEIRKEYSIEDNILVFEGDYFNGKKHGHGKELYLNGDIKFEGEYLNGRRNGKGKEFDNENKLKFEGNYLHGLRQGFGKLYDEDKIIFEGEYSIGKKWNGKIYNNKTGQIYEIKNGYGNVIEYYESQKLELILEYCGGERKKGFVKEYYDDGKTLLFECEYKDGELNGKGKHYDSRGQIKFEGEYLKGKRWNGKGYNDKGEEEYELKDGCGEIIQYCRGKLKFKGDCKDGICVGKEFEKDKVIFEGEYLNGKKHGKGKEYTLDGKLKYDGEYYNGEKWKGKAWNYYANGELEYEGEYLYGKLNGKYNYFYRGGIKKSEGNYLNGKKCGKIKEYDKNGKLIFEGEILNGIKWNGKGYDDDIYEIKNGCGIMRNYYNNGEIEFEGEYINGERNGKGKEFNYNGKLKFEGEYKNGKRNGFGKELYTNGKIDFEGEYLNGEKNGKGKEFFFDKNDVLKFEGEYLNDKRKYGKEYNHKGELIYEGEYINGIKLEM